MKPRIKIVNNGFSRIGILISGTLPLPGITRFSDCGPTIMVIFKDCLPIHVNKN